MWRGQGPPWKMHIVAAFTIDRPCYGQLITGKDFSLICAAFACKPLEKIKCQTKKKYRFPRWDSNPRYLGQKLIVLSTAPRKRLLNQSPNSLLFIFFRAIFKPIARKGRTYQREIITGYDLTITRSTYGKCADVVHFPWRSLLYLTAYFTQIENLISLGE